MKYIVSITFIFLFSACNTLDLSPEDHYGGENFWNNEAQVSGYVIGVHNQLRELSTNLFLLGEARGGLQKYGSSSTSTTLDYSSPIKDQDFTKDKTGISSWGTFYGSILSLNHGIDKIENEIDFLNKEQKDYYLGQLYGLRAFYYFILYRTYGGLPLITEARVLEGITGPEALYMPRSTPKETMDFIKKDINRSIELFGNKEKIELKKALWSKFASLMLKAEVYIWSAKVINDDQTPAVDDLNQAESALSEVKGRFTLLSKFKEVFEYENKGNDEIILAIRFLDNEATNMIASFVYSDNVFVGLKYSKEGKVLGDTLNLKGNGLLRNEYTFDFFEKYDNEDSRKSSTFFDYYDLKGNNEISNGGTVLTKFLGIINTNGNRIYADDIPIYRYADVLLMLAEVENKKGGDPSPYINQIRERAYGENYNAVIHAYINQDFETNELAILYERDKEFVFENKRWFDVLRLQEASGKALAFSTKLGYGKVPVIPVEEKHKVMWPVDVNTLSVDPKLEQTPGY